MNKISTRTAYGEALAEIGSDPRIFVLDADLQCCTRTEKFGALYPERSRNVGIAEANMVGIAAGMATCGKIVFVNSFAMFTAGRAFEQIRNSLAYPHLNVKVIGTHAGVTVGKDGATHQCLEDLAIMRSIPGMVVLSPCDANETRPRPWRNTTGRASCVWDGWMWSSAQICSRTMSSAGARPAGFTRAAM